MSSSSPQHANSEGERRSLFVTWKKKKKKNVKLEKMTRVLVLPLPPFPQQRFSMETMQSIEISMVGNMAVESRQ